MTYKIVLVSKSPRRKEILEKAGYEFEIRVQDADETLPCGIEPQKAVEILAEIKAKAVKRAKNELVIGADTVVVLDGVILGKPKDEKDAFLMLKGLSGKEHKVFTGVCIVTNEKTVTFSEESTVKFESLTETQILEYIKTGEPMDKAGSYGIQGKASSFAKITEGSFYNVMGLPIETLNKKLLEIEKIY